MRPETVDIGHFVAAAAERVRARAATEGITIEYDVEPDLFAIADELRLDQLLDNLTDNALRYAHSRLGLLAARHGTEISVLVCDDGPGFPAAFAQRAFDRFSVADDARAGTHTGLGLAIVAAIARAQGWTVAIAGRTTVELTIPALDLDVIVS